MINHRGDVKISDFGTVRDMESSVASAQTFVGTLTYMSPERIGGEDYSYKSDIWSFGLSLMTIALGHFPYDNKAGYWELLHCIKEKPVPQLPDTFSDNFRDFISQAMHKNQTERPSAKDLLQHPFLQDHHVDNSTTTSRSQTESSREDAPISAELYEITTHLAQRTRKEADRLVEKEDYTFEQVVAWVKNGPNLQLRNLYGLAEQMGISYQQVHQAFETCMNDMLEKIWASHFDE